MCKWSTVNMLIDESQAGFRKVYSAADHMFTIHALAQKYLSKKNRRFYVLFVDFEKAFDNISHSKLFESLTQKGVCGNFLKILLSIYKGNNSMVRTDNSCTSCFPCLKGTRQGDMCSPQIFNLFINDICNHVKSKCDSGIYVSNSIPKIITLMFADDVASPADSVISLQRQINAIEEFSNKSGMKINLTKTQIVVFRNGGPLRKIEKWFLNNTQITVSSFYKYMGLLFTPKLKWSKALTALTAQAKKSLNSINSYRYMYGPLTHYDYFKVFDSMVKPILCYGSELWGYSYRSTVENTQISACKQFLGVGKNTSNQMALGECGRYPLCLDYYVKFLKYWCKLIHMAPYRYPKQCYIMLKKLDDCGRHTYATELRNLLFTHGFGFVWISQDIGNTKAFIT